MIWVVLLLTIGAIALVTRSALDGRLSALDGLGDPVHTAPSTGLPAHPTPADLDDVRFDTALRGYDPFAVDVHLDAVRDGLAVPAEPVFDVVLRGYRMDQVDEVIAAMTPYRVLGLVPTTAEPAAGHSSPLPALADSGSATAPAPTKLGPIDLAVATAYGLFAYWMLSGLAADPRGRYLSQGVQDQQAFEWYFGAAAHNLATWSHPLFSTLQNYPEGVNLMANASVLGLSLPLAPLTLLAGPQLTFLVIEWIGFAATATFWYLLFVRRLHARRLAAAVGGALVGFSPAMVSHGNGHPNFLAQFVVPLIIDRLIALQERGRTRAQWIRGGIGLGLLVTWQLWLGEEVLLLATVGITIVGVAMLVQGRVDLRAMLPGVLVGVATTVLLFAYPLWWQFAGPRSYHTMWQPTAVNDLAALWGRATRTWFADPWAAAELSMNRTEENAFFGIPLWLLAIGIVGWQWRRPVVRAAAVLVVVSTWISLGSKVTLHGERVPVPGLWSQVRHLPLFDGLLATRFTLIAVPGFAVLVVVALDVALRRWRGPTPYAVPLAVVGLGTAVALATIAPTPLVADPRPAVPRFFTSGAWAQYVDEGAVLAVPPPDLTDMRAADWQAAARWGFPLVEGYFMGPDGSGTGKGTRGAVRRPFSTWLAEVTRSGEAMVATPEQVRQFRGDLRAWRVDVVVLPVRPDGGVLAESVRSVLGDPTAVEDVWIWDVRAAR
ncbi:MAG: DivIVA domain-containing protein [Dermatophilaceae bacterium]